MAGEDRSQRCLLGVVVMIVTILSVVGSNTVNVNVNTGKGATGKDKTWMIAVGHDWGALEYLDEAGYLRGFHLEIIAEVCSAANIQCRTVWEPYRNCYDSEPGQHSFGGEGLLGGWYDACTGWLQTVGRAASFDFSMPFLKDEAAYFWVKKGKSFDVTDISNVKAIGFMDGAYTDEKCLARMSGEVKGVPLPASKIKYYPSSDDIKIAIDNNEIDAAYGSHLVLTGEHQDLDRLGDGFMCTIAGASMMTRKDNGFSAEWNRGFQAIVSNGKFKKMCDKAKADHEKLGQIMSPCI